MVNGRLRQAGLIFLGAFLTIGLLALVAMASRIPFVFPSLGPTALLLLFARRAPVSRPWRITTGHAVGLLCGYLALVVTGLGHAPSAMNEGIGLMRVLAAALSLAGTGAAMVLLDAFHPPAAATTLIVSLGIIRRPFHLLMVEAAVGVLVATALLIDVAEQALGAD